MMLFLILVVHIQSHSLRSPEKPLKLAVVSYYEQEGGVLSSSENSKNNKDMVILLGKIKLLNSNYCLIMILPSKITINQNRLSNG